MRPVPRRARCLVTFVSCVLLAASKTPASDGPAPMPHVRTAHAAIRELIREGYRRSPTFRSLFDTVEGSDLIVYVETTTLAPPEAVAWLQYEGTSPVNRFLRIFVKVPTSDEALIVLVGHELQHATEVAAASDVRDQHSLEALYRRTGDWSGAGWDSAAARLVSKIVRDEMRSAVQPASGRR
jgi:hypothetical protein